MSHDDAVVGRDVVELARVAIAAHREGTHAVVALVRRALAGEEVVEGRPAVVRWRVAAVAPEFARVARFCSVLIVVGGCAEEKGKDKRVVG